MDLSLERDSSVLGSLFNQIIADMKNTSPLWEDFIAKASKLHACLRAAIQAISAYLDAFQKIADAATNSRGATKEIGTALTRVCLRHKAVETRLKTFTTAIMDCLVLPLQDKLEDWKRSVVTIDKEHAKEHKRCRAELKKRSNDTLRLQKKARKGQSETIQSLVDSHMQDVTQRRVELEEVEKRSLRSAMIEERMRYCTFVHMLQPVVKEECEVMSEMGHLQEAMQSIALVTKEPSVLPQASEELILDAKSAISLYSESPGGSGGCSNSLGSRKSSVCSISSMNSSGSSGSPGHHHYQRSLSQFVSPAIRLKPGESSDSGFCSSPALTTQVSTVTSQSHAVSTWPPHSQDVEVAPTADRPHTISTTYEKGHQRPPLTVYTFQNPETIMESGGTSVTSGGSTASASGQTTPSTQKASAGALSRPPLPVRCSSLERPLSANNNRNGVGALAQRQCPSPIPAHITKELSAHHAQQQQQLQAPPTYVNMSELASMAALKISAQQQQHHTTPPVLQQQQSTDSHSSISSIISNDSISTSQQNHNHSTAMTATTNTPRSHSNHSHSTASSSATPSLHSHPSIDSTVATPLVGQTPTPSSGCSTPQNHYSPLLTNSPSSTAAGTPSGGSGCPSGFVFNINSPTTAQTATGNCTPSSTASGSATGVADMLKITETDSPNIAASSTEASANNTDQTSSSTNNTDSPTIIENDERSRASVLQKASMFEKQAAAVSKGSPSQSPAGVARNNSAVDITGGSIYGLRRIEDYRAPTPVQQQTEYAAPEKDAVLVPVDRSFEDSIQELNNLIGELDSFQREIDASKQHQTTHHASKSSELHEGHNGRNTIATTTTIEAVVTTTTTLAQAATTLLTYEHQQKHAEQRSTHSCPSSNQTNSSGCGTDISDATSDELAAIITADKNSIASVNCIKDNSKNVCYCSSDSELGSRCSMSCTSSIVGGINDGGGYENPTFAHLADSRSLLTVGDCMSQTSEKLSSSHQQQAFLDNGSNENSTSAVVVIYDHQIPMTPDIDYVKKNSEIVVLRTKDPQQLHHHQQQEMRELQHLPSNLSTLDGDGQAHSTPTIPATATMAPANQRLSSFRASSEQQLQILSGCNNNICQKQQQQKGTQRLSTDSRNSPKSPAAISTLPSSAEAPTLDDSVMRRKLLPPKPTSCSIFSGTNGNTEVNNNKKNCLQQQYQPQQQLPVAIKADFKADLDAKIRKQKEKLLRQEQHQQQEQQQQQLPQSLPVTNNCNTNKYRSALPLPSVTTTTPSATSSSHPLTNDNICSLSAPFSPSSTSSCLLHQRLHCNNSANSCLPSTPSQQQQTHSNNNNHQQNHFHLPYVTNSPTTTLLSSSVSTTPLNLAFACSATAADPPVPTVPSPGTGVTTSALLVPSSSSSSSHSSMSSCAAPSAVAKPNISPRPASLSGGSTRIARRSSVNTAKPPPPVRRSSSVTPSQNIISGQQPPDPSTSSASNLLYQHHPMDSSIESLPPPPAYLLVEQSQVQSTPTSPAPPPYVIPASTLKVAETVKALSALRYQPASPNAHRRVQIANNNGPEPQPHHYHQQPTTTLKIQTHTNTYDTSFTPAPKSSFAPPSTLSSEPKDCYNPYVEVNQRSVNYSSHSSPASTTLQSSSSILADCNKTSPYHNQQQHQHHHQKQHQVFCATSLPSTPSPPPPVISHDHATGPPPLPPPNPNRYQHNQNRHHRQNQAHHQQQQLIYSNNCQSNNINGNQSSFRTSSPGIYAQPKIVSNMSSFRTSSPSPSNGGHQLHQPQAQLPPTQPKTNPNLIAQLNARLNKQQQQQPQVIASDQTTYCPSPNSPHNQQQSENVYMRNYATQQQQHLQQQHVQQYQQQQHNHDGKSTTTNNRTYGSFSTSSSSTNSTSTNFHHNSSPHFPLSSSTSSLLSKVTSFSSTSSSTKSSSSAFSHQPNQQANFQNAVHLNLSPLNLQQNVAAASSNRTQQAAAMASSSTQQYHPQQQQLPHYHAPLYNRENYITCPPPLEDPPPPPTTVASIPKSATGSCATMPKNCARSSAPATTVAIGTGLQNLATYAAATASASATLPKNLQQQRLLYQQQYQQQQYHHPPDITATAISLHQQHTSNNNNQRPQMPLPQQHHQHQQQLFKHKPPPASTPSSNNYKQPPVPARHSSVQQKIYVTTNPFIQTTAIHCGPTASGSPSSAAANCSSSVGINSAGGAAHIHPLQQQQYHSPQQQYILPGSHCGHNSISVAAATTNTNHATSTNVDKNGVGCSSMRSKSKAEFLENLNAKLAKQGISGRAFAVRNLINSKALPDPRLCHESLMDQIKRGATLKRNQKINDRSAPKIH